MFKILIFTNLKALSKYEGMSLKSAKAGLPPAVEANAASEAPTKVVKMDSEVLNVSTMISKANFFHRISRDLETLYSMHDRFNSMFFNPETLEGHEIKAVFLSLEDASERYVTQDKTFKVTNPETILKIRALVSLELANKITELENRVLTFTI